MERAYGSADEDLVKEGGCGGGLPGADEGLVKEGG